MRKTMVVVAFLAAVALPGLLASAMDEPVWMGTVTEISGPEDSVVVLRGTDAYALYPDDKLFKGDKVFTRTNGAARLLMDGCEIALESASFVEVNDKVCEVQITQLDPEANFAGIPVLAAGPTLPQTGAAIGLTPLLATGAGAAAVAGAAAGGTGEGVESNIVP